MHSMADAVLKTGLLPLCKTSRLRMLTAIKAGIPPALRRFSPFIIQLIY